MGQKFCKKCGEELSPELVFCSTCGTPIPDSTSVQSTEYKTKQRKPMPLKAKVLLSIIAVLCVLSIGTHFILSHVTDSTKQLKNIYNAIIDENGKALFAELTIPEGVLYVEGSFTKNLNNDFLPEFYEELSDAVERVKKSELTEIVLDNHGIEVFRIKHDKWLYFYPRALIEPVSQSLVIDTDLNNTILTIAGEEFPLDGKPITINKVLPDEYTVTLNGKNTFFESEGTAKIDRDIFLESASISLLNTSYSIEFEGESVDSILYVNGKTTDKSIQDIGTIEPIFGKGATFHAVRTIEGDKTEESEKVSGKPGDSITFAFPSLIKAEQEAQAKEHAEIEQAEKADEDKELIRQASETYVNFRHAYEDALNNRSFDYITSYLQPSGKAFGELKKFIAEADGTYYLYEFMTNEVTGGKVEGNLIKLQVRETFLFENHLSQTTNYDRNKEYDLIENSFGQFEIVEIHIKDTNRDKY